MNTILEIKKPSSKSFIVWEHVMISSVTFTGTFILLFFGPMFLSSKSRNHDSSNDPGISIIEYLSNHPVVYFGLTVLAVIIANVYIIMKNQKTKYIVKIEQDDHIMRFELTNLYFTKFERKELEKNDFEFYFETKVSQDEDKQQRIIFRNKTANSTVGEIIPKHFIWNEQIIRVKNLLIELQAFKVKSRQRKTNVPGISTLFSK